MLLNTLQVSREEGECLRPGGVLATVAEEQW
jgi:hypothetical protein